MAYFEKVTKYNDIDINLPVRATAQSAGYDFEVAEDTVIPSYRNLMNHIDGILNNIEEDNRPNMNAVYPLTEIKDFMKKIGVQPTLVPTGVKCGGLADDEYLELSVRSSTPRNYWLILGNAVGEIDADYYNNEDNEGEIFFQFINLSPFNILLKKGDKVGQGIIHVYHTTSDDNATGERKGGFGSTSVE